MDIHSAIPASKSFLGAFNASDTAGRRVRNHADCDSSLDALHASLRSTGGVLSTDHVLELLRRDCHQPISQLARWIVLRQVVHVTAKSYMWFPAFQFRLGVACLKPGLSRVLEELSPVLDDWEVATWFSLPNASLDGAAPSEVLETRPFETWQATRLDRFVGS